MPHKTRQQKIVRRKDGAIFTYTEELAARPDMRLDYIDVPIHPGERLRPSQIARTAPAPTDEPDIISFGDTPEEAAAQTVTPVEPCPNCHTANAIDANFCSNCGFRLVDPDDAEEVQGQEEPEKTEEDDDSAVEADVEADKDEDIEAVSAEVLSAVKRDMGYADLETKKELVQYAKIKFSKHFFMRWKEETMRRKLRELSEAYTETE